MARVGRVPPAARPLEPQLHERRRQQIRFHAPERTLPSRVARPCGESCGGRRPHGPVGGCRSPGGPAGKRPTGTSGGQPVFAGKRSRLLGQAVRGRYYVARPSPATALLQPVSTSSSVADVSGRSAHRSSCSGVAELILARASLDRAPKRRPSSLSSSAGPRARRPSSASRGAKSPPGRSRPGSAAGPRAQGGPARSARASAAPRRRASTRRRARTRSSEVRDSGSHGRRRGTVRLSICGCGETRHVWRKRRGRGARARALG